ncbi:prolipoprotein diacylglyceryl transferase [Hydrotalea sandarakina]|jgi:prolipoprotein diacylglyceryltransferase|uniref:Prolipoprotein diacylglyceryltransferase n=1 Tax=Hydrotalea sandarakina TaxID=1004304 RepID=A0A2W7S422_9BACT|nr:prolipoprotein diacylglyceryl transferase family protein [Hydrotalea sandarakina]PZX65856.1 prolipoprotein diacylglyceryltransferase [Hydrotalea sandarakina]
MYPNLYYVFKDLFGVEWNGLKLINSFGFFVAISFVVSAWVLTLELKRKQAAGILTYTEKTIVVGGPASVNELILNFILGFVLGFKIIGAFLIPAALSDPQAFILSAQGNWPLGIILGIVFAFLKWREKEKEKLAKPEKRIIRVWPQDRVGDIVIYAAIFGFAGAKIFNSLETWDDFVQDPIGSLISFSGLTFYGGLICATIALYYYTKKHKIPFIALCDAAAPALMLAYALGRIGCQVAGDGDWGILNSAYISNAEGKLVPATMEQFNRALQANQLYYSQQFSTFKIQHLSVQAFWGLPKWLFAYNYPHNVVNEGIHFANCTGNYCSFLPISVFPTPLYEIIMCLILFFVLWALRKKITTPGKLFAIYLILNGLERFLIEKIRVNTRYHFWGLQPTQAELISSALVIGGIILFIYSKKIKLKQYPAL